MTVKTRTDLEAAIVAALPDNTTGAISPADVRQSILDVAESAFFPEDTTVPDAISSAINTAVAGKMPAATYDPNAVGADAFDMANMVEAANAKIMTAAERTALGTAIQTTATDASGFGFVAGKDDTPADKSKVVPTVARVEAYVDSRALSRLSAVRKTNLFPHGSMIHGDSGWSYYKTASEPTFIAVDVDGTETVSTFFGRRSMAMNATASGSIIFAGPSTVFSVDASKDYLVGIWATAYGGPLPGNIKVKCYDLNNQLIDTLTVSVSVADAGDPITSQHTAKISAVGGAAPAFPAGTVTATVLFGWTTTASSQGMRIWAAYMIADDDLPQSIDATIVNTGGGTHEAVSDGTYLYVVNHGVNEVVKFDKNLKKVATLSVEDYPHHAAVLGDDLWVVCQDAKALQRISLSTFSLIWTLPILGGRAGYGAATDGSRLFIGAGTGVQGSAILEVVPSTGAMTVLSTDVNTHLANVPVVCAGGSVWSLDESNNQIKRIDPDTGATVASITVSIGDLYGIGAGDGYVFANGQSGIVQIATADNSIVRTYPFHDLPVGGSNVEVVDGVAYGMAWNGVMAIDYAKQEAREMVLDAGGMKWVRALPDGTLVAGAYAAPWLFTLDLR